MGYRQTKHSVSFYVPFEKFFFFYYYFFYFNHIHVLVQITLNSITTPYYVSPFVKTTPFFSLPTLTFVHNNHQLSTSKPLLMKVVRSKRVEDQNTYLQKHITIHTKIRLPVYFNSKVYFRLYDV